MMYVPGIASSIRRNRLALLAPSADVVPPWFHTIDVDSAKHGRMLARLQRLRGQVYLADGAIQGAQLTGDGRHTQPIDDTSWHVLSVHDDGEITGCARFCAHDAEVRPERLGVWRSPLAYDRLWSPWLRRTVQSEILTARRRNQLFVEVGGWAIGEPFRFTADAIDIALSMFALARTVGGCIGITTATVRNHSSRILRKLGGRPLEIDGCLIPSYYDPHYKCEMEILRFDSTLPNPRYNDQIERIASGLVHLPVLCAAPVTSRVIPFQPRVPALAARMQEAYA